MASRSAGRGEPPALALVDTLPPLGGGDGSVPDEAELLEVVIRDLGGLGGRKLEVDRDELLALESGKRLDYVLEKAHAAKLFPVDVRREQTRRLLEVYRANLAAMSRYAPPPCPGGLTLFCSRAFTEHYRQAADGWRSLCGGPVTIVELPGDHYSILAKPCVAELAAGLETFFGSGEDGR